MDEKASLMVKSQKLSQQIDSIKSEIQTADKKLSELPGRVASQKDTFVKASREAFEKKKKAKHDNITKVVSAKRSQVEQLIDSFPGVETKEFAGRIEIKGMESHLMEVYPQGMIQDYICLNPVIFKEDGEAYQSYRSIENMVMKLRQNNLPGEVFNGLSAVLDKAADVPQLGTKVALLFILVFVGGLVFSPFLLLTAITLLGLVSGAQGRFVQHLLRKLYSVKLYLNESYDEDIFAKDKGDMMECVDEFLAETEQEYHDLVDTDRFEPSPEKLAEFDKRAAKEQQRLQASRQSLAQDLDTLSRELEQVVSALEALYKREEEIAKEMRTQYLGTLNWEHQWPATIFLDVTPENRIKMLSYSQANSLYYGESLDLLKQLSRLVVFQSIMRMHPHYAVNKVLDYKYNGGDLTQFAPVPKTSLTIAYTEDDLAKEVELISNKVRARTNNILGSCQNIEEYNSIMREYDSPGEYYMIVHVFGMESCTGTMQSMIRNGARVGVFFKFYLTTEELKLISDGMPFEYFSDFYEILENPMPRKLPNIMKLCDKSG